MDAEYDFIIIVRSKGKRFRMEVKKVYEGDSLQRFKVKGGDRFIILQSNLPQIQRENSRMPIEWKLLEGDIASDNPKASAEALNEIIIAIEYKMKEQTDSMEAYIKYRSK